MKKFLLTLALVTAFAAPVMARDAVQIPSGTYLEFPDPEGQPLSFDGSDGSYGMGRYGVCTIIKKSVKIDPAGLHSFDANCVDTHGDKFVSHEKWQLEPRGGGGDTYLVTVSTCCRGYTEIAIWKRLTE
jgi:hypothetical protein